MGRKLPEDVANRITIRFSAGEPIEAVHTIEVSISCLYQLQLNFERLSHKAFIYMLFLCLLLYSLRKLFCIM
jgi:hypothetical protein